MPVKKNPRMTEETVPAAAEPETPALSAKERLKQKAKKVASPSGPKKKEREIIELNRDEDKICADAVDRLTAAVHARAAIKGHEDAAKAIVMPYIRSIILRDWVAQGRKLENKRVITPNGSSFNMQCKDTLTGVRGFRCPKDKDGDPIGINQHLASNGVPDALIARLTKDAEFTEELIIGVNIALLEKEAPALANRLMDLIDAAGNGGVTTKAGKKIEFTDEEMNKIVTQNNDVTVKEGFLERAVTHCLAVSGGDEEVATEMLSQLLSAVPPQWAVGQAMCLHPDEGIVRLLHEKPPEIDKPAKPVEPAKPVDHDSTDNLYIMRVEGLTVTVIRKRDNKEVAKKVCKDEAHTVNTVKIWQRNPASLTAFIAENAP